MKNRWVPTLTLSLFALAVFSCPNPGTTPATTYQFDVVMGFVTVDQGGTVFAGGCRPSTVTDFVVTIRNTGSATITLGSGTGAVSLGGADASLFSVSAQPPSQVDPGKNAAFTLHFAPTTTGLKSATVSFATSVTGYATFSFTLTATGTVLGASPTWHTSRQTTWESNFYHAAFADSLHGWAVGSNNMIVATTDGGATWARQSSPFASGSDIARVCCTDSSHAWTATTSQVAATTNGGATWQVTGTIPGQNGYGFMLEDLDFVDSQDGWCTGYWSGTSVVLQTTDGGANWSQQQLPATCTAFRLDFASTQTGWVCGYVSGGTYYLFKTTNGGTNWTTDYSSSSVSIYDIQFLSASAGWMARSDGVWFWNGTLWSQKSTQYFYRVSFSDASNGWALGSAAPCVTSNGGTTWNATTAPTQGFSPTDIVAAGTGRAVVTGVGGYIGLTTNAGVSWTAETAMDFPSVSSIFFADDSNGWAGLESEGIVLATSNGGSTWTRAVGPSDPSDICFTDGTHGWACEYYVYATSNGGTSWSSLGGSSSRSLSFTSGSNGWTAGDAGYIAVTTNGGTNWTPQASGTTCDLKCVRFLADGQHGWACGGLWISNYQSWITRTSNGGTTWSAGLVGKNGDAVSRLFFLDTQRGWAPWYNLWDTSAGILRTVDGGATWERIKVDGARPGNGCQDIWMANACEGFAILGGALYRTMDGGSSWCTADCGMAESLTRLSHTSGNRLWVAGEFGVVAWADVYSP